MTGAILSSHVLDAALGAPAAGLTLTLVPPEGSEPERAVTDADGRVRFATKVGPGAHTLVFGTGAWFAAAGRATFYPTVTVRFSVAQGDPHHHVALLLSPFSYTTYRGS